MYLKHGRPGRMYQSPRGQRVVIERIDPEDRVFFRTKTHTDGPQQSGLSEIFPMGDWKYVGIGREAGHCVCGLPLKERGEELVCTSPQAEPGGSRTLLHSTFSTPRRHPTASPWGPIGHVEHLGYGVEAVSTATHGGLRLSAEAADRLPSDVASTFYKGPGWPEEDCEAPIAAALLGIGGETAVLVALTIAKKLDRYAVAVPYLEAIGDFEAVS